jgi:uncharacterized phage-associated protein
MLTNWVVGHFEGDDLTPLKLQKLLFYCAGVVAAFEFGRELGAIPFHAWRLGPVNREVYQKFKPMAATPLTPAMTADLPSPQYSHECQGLLGAVLTVYGHLPATALVNETHREAPWRDSYVAGEDRAIDPVSIGRHFQSKFRDGFMPPSVAFAAGDFLIDGIPISRFESIFALADALKNARSQ